MRITDETTREQLLDYIKALEFNLDRYWVRANSKSLESVRAHHVCFALLNPNAVPMSCDIGGYVEPHNVYLRTVEFRRHLQ